MSGVELLACAILEQAIEDYKYLKEGYVLYPYDKKKYEREYIAEKHKKKLEKFFKSEWCANLLSVADCKFKGSDILEMLESLPCEEVGEVAL